MIKSHILSRQGIVLVVNSYQDDSAIVTLGTSDGLMSVIARHIYQVKSQLKPLLNIGSVVYVEYKISHDGLNFVNYAKPLIDSSLLYEKLETSSFLFFLSQLSTLLFSEGDSFPYEDIENIIAKLKDDGDCLSLALLLIGVFYKNLGLKQEVNYCIKCHKTQNIVYFDVKEGGFICQDCIKMGQSPKSKEELYVIKYAFSSVTDKNLNRLVPKNVGKKVLHQLVMELLEYYDLKKCESLELFLSNLL